LLFTRYYSCYRIEEDEIAGTYEKCVMEKKCKDGLVRKPEARRPLGDLGLRWEDNISLGLKGVEWDSVGWINLAYDRSK
jgi:hypothetical protein